MSDPMNNVGRTCWVLGWRHHPGDVTVIVADHGILERNGKFERWYRVRTSNPGGNVTISAGQRFVEPSGFSEYSVPVSRLTNLY